MNCFQLVKTVLDELYERIQATTEVEKDNNIRSMMKYLEAQYAGLARGLQIDYTDPTTRFAYIYRYVTSHANIVYQIISSSSDLAGIFERDKINVTCVGGGPGSDFLGILKYVLLARLEPFLRCTLLDGEATWADCWNDVDEKLASQLRITNIFQTFDVTDPKTWATTSKYLNSDLFTMIYFMSEVDSLREAAEPFFSNLFGNAKSGALFLYVDNNNAQFYNWFDSLAFANGLNVIRSSEVKMGISDYSEEKTDLGEYWTKFGSPKLSGNIAFRICQKS